VVDVAERLLAGEGGLLLVEGAGEVHALAVLPLEGDGVSEDGGEGDVGHCGRRAFVNQLELAEKELCIEVFVIEVHVHG